MASFFESARALFAPELKVDQSRFTRLLKSFKVSFPDSYTNQDFATPLCRLFLSCS